jgi:hypothetical protein
MRRSIPGTLDVRAMAALAGNSNMKAIDTRYRGYRFRSRLEARWAVFFDKMDTRWEYEPQGYALPGAGAYLPDFYLPESKWLLDIKPLPPNFDGEPWMVDGSKEERFAKTMISREIGFAVVFGTPGPVVVDNSEKHSYAACIYGDSPYFFCTCPECGKLGLEYCGHGERICPHSTGAKCFSYDDPRLLCAFDAARAARFEFGETPA